jgi:hypothetical protein
MGVTYDLIDAPYPYLCAVYRCRCGGTVTRHGDEAGAPPPGWQVHAGEDGESDDVLCPGCAARAEATAAEATDGAPGETR